VVKDGQGLRVPIGTTARALMAEAGAAGSPLPMPRSP
jgi:hypothetical protein